MPKLSPKDIIAVCLLWTMGWLWHASPDWRSPLFIVGLLRRLAFVVGAGPGLTLQAL